MGFLDKLAEYGAPHGVLELADGLGFDLPHAFSRHFEDATDFFQGIRVAVTNPVAELDDLALAVRQRLEQRFNPLFVNLASG